MKHVAPVVLSILIVSASCAQTPATQPSEKAEAARRLLLEGLKQHGVQLDLAKQTVTIPAWINDPPPPDPIEYVLVHARGKRHEAVLVTEVKASMLNGALLLLGYKEGKNASFKEKNPLPPREEIEKGAPIMDIVPPSGMAIYMTVIREIEGGKTKEDPIEEYLVDAMTGRPVEDASWVFLGGRMAKLYRNEPEVYLADYEGNLVSSCYMSPENHLVTMRHVRANDDQNWLINGAVCPAAGAKVSLVFHLQEPKLCRDREARIAEEQKKRGAESQPAASHPNRVPGSGR